MANKNSNSAVQTNTLQSQVEKENRTMLSHTMMNCTRKQLHQGPHMKTLRNKYINKQKLIHHPVHARNKSRPNSGLSFAKLNMKVYMITVGSATRKISKGCPPRIECIMPHIEVDANV